mmetsp:Transcript_49991/g.119339  ORF Transcript_49991/g.119339 Transcript_49991/m.119339 type:complete len:245 (-) Transcript_49991:1242-1976(-)
MEHHLCRENNVRNPKPAISIARFDSKRPSDGLSTFEVSTFVQALAGTDGTLTGVSVCLSGKKANPRCQQMLQLGLAHHLHEIVVICAIPIQQYHLPRKPLRHKGLEPVKCFDSHPGCVQHIDRPQDVNHDLSHKLHVLLVGLVKGLHFGNPGCSNPTAVQIQNRHAFCQAVLSLAQLLRLGSPQDDHRTDKLLPVLPLHLIHQALAVKVAQGQIPNHVSGRRQPRCREYTAEVPTDLLRMGEHG